MASYPVGVTKTIGNWRANNASVERPTDNATYEAAQPEDSLVCVGPARRDVAVQTANSPRSLLALGMLQSISFSTNAPLTPLMAIGSARPIVLRGKSQTTWSMQRVMINGRNLLRALYHNAVLAGINADQFDDPAALDGAPRSQFFINLDSELFYIPIGFAVIIRSKSHGYVAGMYAELCLISAYGFAMAAGQTMLAESVQGLCDRILPYQASDMMGAIGTNRAALDAVLGLAGNIFPEYSKSQIAQFSDDGLADGNLPLVAA